MSVTITEVSATFRQQSGTLEETVAALEAQGWQVDSSGPGGSRLVHPSLPGHSRIVSVNA